MNTRRTLLYLFILMSFFLVLAVMYFIPPVQENGPVVSESGNTVVKRGVSIAMQIEPLGKDAGKVASLREGDDAHIKVTLLDDANREPLAGLHPAVWLSRRNASEKKQSCEAQIKAFLQGGLSVQPEVNLNAYYILALNDKASISVIDPHKGFGGSKLVTRIMLHSPGSDWVLSKDHKKLFVSTPLSKEIAVVDTSLWKTVAFIPFDGVPGKLALQADGKRLWVGLDADADSFRGVAVIDPDTNKVLGRLETGGGGHDFAFGEDDRFVYVGNAEANTILIIDGEKLTVVETIKPESVPVSVAYSSASKSVLAALENGKLWVIDASSHHVVSELKLSEHLTRLSVSPDGHWGFAVSQADNKVFIIDMANNRLVHSLAMGDEPDQIAFSDTFAYIHSTGSESVRLVQLNAIGKNQALAAMDFPAGQTAPGRTVGNAIVATPERMGVIVANPVDKAIFYYMEGMAAPMGSFDNYGLAPESVMILDRSMREAERGVYIGSAALPPAGAYTAAVLLQHPKVFHCFDVNIEADSNKAITAKMPVKLDYLITNKKVRAGDPVTVKLKLYRSTDTRPVEDLEILVTRTPGLWQQRKLVKPAGDDIYQVEITPPQPGLYQIFARSKSMRLAFEDLPSTSFNVLAKELGEVVDENYGDG